MTFPSPRAMRGALVAPLALAAATACAPALHRASPTAVGFAAADSIEAEVARTTGAVAAARARLIEGIESRDAVAIAAVLASDATLVLFERDTVRGREAAAERLVALVAVESSPLRLYPHSGETRPCVEGGAHEYGGEIMVAGEPARSPLPFVHGAYAIYWTGRADEGMTARTIVLTLDAKSLRSGRGPGCRSAAAVGTAARRNAAEGSIAARRLTIALVPEVLGSGAVGDASAAALRDRGWRFEPYRVTRSGPGTVAYPNISRGWITGAIDVRYRRPMGRLPLEYQLGLTPYAERVEGYRHEARSFVSLSSQEQLAAVTATYRLPPWLRLGIGPGVLLSRTTAREENRVLIFQGGRSAWWSRVSGVVGEESATRLQLGALAEALATVPITSRSFLQLRGRAAFFGATETPATPGLEPMRVSGARTSLGLGVGFGL